MLNYNEVRDNAQNGYHTADGIYHEAGAAENISTAVGHTHVYRFSTMVPFGATVTAAALRVHIGAKDGNSDQSVSYNVSVEALGNSPALVDNEQFSYRSRHGSISKTVNFTQSTQTWSDYNVDVLSLIQNFMDRPEYVPGAYITFALAVTAEVGDINFNTDYKPFGGEKPSLSITYTSESNGIYTEFNLMDNPSGTVDSNWWGENDAFGTFVTGGSLSVDNTQQRITGRATLKYTLPASNPDTKPAGIGHGTLLPGDSKKYIFCGWIYIPAAITGQVYPQFMWEWDGSHPVTERDQWVPFCCNPVGVWSTPAGVTPMIHISTPFTGSDSIWLSDCAVYESDFRQTPWSGEAEDRKDIDFNYTYRLGRGVQTRVISPKLNYTESTSASFNPVRKYALRADGMWTVVSTTRESTSWDDLKTNGMTWDQLEATSKTWDEMEADTTI